MCIHWENILRNPTRMVTRAFPKFQLCGFFSAIPITWCFPQFEFQFQRGSPLPHSHYEQF